MEYGGVTIIDRMSSPQEELGYGHLVSSDITNLVDSEQKIHLSSLIYSSWYRVAIAPNPQATFLRQSQTVFLAGLELTV